ncbi:D-alanine--D-alanine ligase [Aerosakkonemataceae cyanobacterium BLCC-F50]|uniref:D-alanine--D-alanine ligase n=1 Tax=Floridaenema flaviceps BLCC-F50 TaxID=3153642 RepID=A0ABV4XVJ5_9CYAN
MVLRILHLVGSTDSSDFYCDLSLLFAGDCLTATANPALYEFHIAYVSPDRLWRFPPSLSKQDLSSTEPVSLAQAVQIINDLSIDLVVPQMFCIPGMTQYRALFDLLHIPYVGNAPEVMALAAHKHLAKAIVAAAGVNVPAGELLKQGDVPTMKPPVVVKPASSDNSLGTTLVKEFAEYDAALTTAFNYSEQVLVEDYIELGREVRCGIIERQGELVALPLEEYQVNAQNHPIRNFADKFKHTETGALINGKDNLNTWSVDPTDPITAVVQQVAKKCHQALGCRHYSLFDFRVDPQGQPWFLEAGLYCSFAKKSAIAMMAQAFGISVDELLSIAIAEALGTSPSSAIGKLA